jgi:protein AATF/BFR2
MKSKIKTKKVKEDVDIDSNIVSNDEDLSEEENELKNKINNFDKVENEKKKYKGEKISYDDYLQKQNNLKEEEDVEQDFRKNKNDFNNQIEDKEAIKERKKFEKTEQLLEKEDEEYLKSLSKYSTTEVRKGKNVKTQKSLFEFLIGVRISIQKLLSLINLFPQGESMLNKFIDKSNMHLVTSLIKEIIYSVKNLITIQHELFTFKISPEMEETQKYNFENVLKIIKSILSEIEKDEENFIFSLLNKHNVDGGEDLLGNLFSHINTFSQSTLSISEKLINIWYRKTSIYSQGNKPSSKTLQILNNKFCEHIKKNLNSHFDVLRTRTKKKITMERIFGKRARSIAEEYDDEIYTDADFYNHLLKEFIQNKENVENNPEEEKTKSRMDLTYEYLLNRNKMKKTNNVDKKASKNRKIRFDKHDKLINFMVPLMNSKLHLGRDEFLNSLFGSKNKLPNKEKDEELNLIDDIELI